MTLYTEAQAGPAAAQFKKANGQGAGFGLGQGIFFLLYALAFWYGSKLVDAGEIDAGAVFKCFFAVVFLVRNGVGCACCVSGVRVVDGRKRAAPP